MIRLIFILSLGLSVLIAGPVQANETMRIDRVLVDKSDRQLHLMRGGTILKSFPIGLGFSPEGHKQQEGDGRTPEGEYVLDWRNPKSSFYLSIHISYPNVADTVRAQTNGVDPGGEIFIHGRHSAGSTRNDWTFGCVAVTDAAMDEIWRSVPNGTPITIRP
jgi:murein L,D-transpeptidase YafK